MRVFIKILMAALILGFLAVSAYTSGVFSGFSLVDVKVVRIDAGISTVQTQEVKRKISEISTESLSPGLLKSTLENLEWIDFVTIKRGWPDQLIVKVFPHKPMAVFNDNHYINADGQVFRSPYVEPVKLPHLYGEVSKGVEMMSQYQKLNMALLKDGLFVSVLELTERGVWRFVDQYGVQVILGKHSVSERLRRYLHVYRDAGVREKINEIKRIDTRYSNGIAVEWKSGPLENGIAANL